ncbi:hypothetical protein H3146_21360 [Streptomyces sp. OF3]|uniref:DUF6571 domain-containing protein n=1 Tax=Streptomyces alkaliterrae TaxID=2213162 RepID=A0A7W3WP03_9ACTN|nr:DUF6571 family protein [Streptomyces alkaliterrae]MBB1255887.1 hypothetical protein [Streptomyces alkaliterrae]
MVQYADIKHIDCKKLTVAAESWTAAAKRYSALQRTYETSVQTPLKRSGWKGQPASSAAISMAATNRDLSAAESEARAVGKILEEGSRKLSALLKALEGKESAIRKDGLHVAADGTVWGTLATDKDGDTRVAKSGDREQQIASLNARVRKWQREINDIVLRVANVDASLKAALDKATGVTDKEGNPRFNGNASSDLERAKIKRGEELITKLNSGESLTSGERDELRAITNDAARDRGLSKRFMTAIGPNSFLRLSGWLQYMKATEKGNIRADYSDIAKNMAGVLASATKDEKDAKEWAAKFKEVGTRAYSWNENGRAASPSLANGDGYRYSLKGYQALMTIMKEGRGYSKEFLHAITDGIREVEEKERTAWKTHLGTYPRGSIVDPLDAALGIMAKQPEAATGYLTPGLLKHMDGREWKVLEGSGVMGGPYEKELSDTRDGFGKFLEAAATGRPPGVDPPDGRPDHSAGERKAVGVIMDHFKNPGKAGIHPELRQPISRILADYSENVYETVGKWKLTLKENDVLGVNVNDLNSIIYAVSEDPNAHRVLFNSQAAEIARQLDENLDRRHFAPTGTFDSRAADYAKEAGTVLGVIDKARAEAIGAEFEKALSSKDQKKLTAYHTVGAAITIIPGIGDAMQRALDSALYGYTEGLKEEERLASNEKLRTLHTHGLKVVQELIEAKANEYKGIPEETGSELQRSLSSGRDGYAIGGKIAGMTSQG